MADVIANMVDVITTNLQLESIPISLPINELSIQIPDKVPIGHLTNNTLTKSSTFI